MAGQWQRRGFSQDKHGGYVRTLSWDEYNGDLPKVDYLPTAQEDLVIFRPFVPPRRIYAHHERIWPGTHAGRTRYGWPSRPSFPPRQRPQLKLIAGDKA